MSFFNSTLTSGIQDISAILPLLGTEQVEKHIGSALFGGYLYAAASPISLFGSLGAAKVAFKLAIACTVIHLSPHRSWIGAQWLADSGLSTTGDAAYLVGSPEAHLRITSVINKSYIDIVDKLHIQLKPGYIRWNINLIFLALLFAAIGNIPYIYLLQHSSGSPDSIPLWVYPFMRTLGTVIIVTCPQFMIQLRLLQILRNHIIFLSLRKLHSTQEKGQADPNILQSMNLLDMITKESEGKSAEEWIRRLKHKLSSEPGHVDIQQTLHAQEAKHGVPHSTTIFLNILGILILMGGIITVIGYIGSFTVVQSASNSLGPLIWLATEGGLSILRILIWGSNPSFDDHQGFLFILDTSSYTYQNSSLIAYINPEHEKQLSLTESNSFLRETAYIRPVEPLAYEGISVFYTLTGSTQTPSAGVLYVTIYNYATQAPHITVKIADFDSTKWEYFKVCDADWGASRIRIGAKISTAGNDLAKNKKFIEQLQNHCREIFDRLNEHNCSSQSMTGDLEAQTTSLSQISDNYQLDSNWLWALKRSKTAENKLNNLGIYNSLEMLYVKYRSSELDARNFYQRHGWWNEAYMALIQDELLPKKPTGNKLLLGDKLELVEIEHLLASEALALERVLERQVASWELSLSLQFKSMIDEILPGLGNAGENHPLVNQLNNRRDIDTTNRSKVGKEASFSRLSEQSQSAMDRIRSWPESYNLEINTDPEIERWKEVQGDRIWQVATKRAWAEEGAGQGRAANGSLDRHLDHDVNELSRELDHNINTYRLAFTASQAKADRDPEFSEQNRSNFKMAVDGCLARFKAMQRRWQMNEDFQNVTKQVLSDKILEEGTEKEAREHIATMVHIMQSKYTKYLGISNDLIRQAGSLDMLLSIIKYNKVITVITVSAKLDLEEEVKIHEVADRMVNVTHCSMDKDMINKRTPPDFAIVPSITYNMVKVVNQHRRSNPYLLFSTFGESRCMIYFRAPDVLGSSSSGGKVCLLLSHCGTRIHHELKFHPSYFPTRIRIKLELSNRAGAHRKTIFNRVYSEKLEYDDFAKQYIEIDVDSWKLYYWLTIQLEKDSGAAYRLNHVELVASEYTYQWRKENPALQEDKDHGENEEEEDDNEEEDEDEDEDDDDDDEDEDNEDNEDEDNEDNEDEDNEDNEDEDNEDNEDEDNEDNEDEDNEDNEDEEEENED